MRTRRYANNIEKGFATALATILTCLMSIPLFGFQISLLFCTGMAIVVASVLIYGRTVRLPGTPRAATPSIACQRSVCGPLRTPCTLACSPHAHRG